MDTPRQKSDLVLLFELASGWELCEYLHDRVITRKLSVKTITEEMNAIIKDFLLRKSSRVIRAKLFLIMPSNLSRWYGMFGIKSQVKKGRKKNADKKRV